MNGLFQGVSARFGLERISLILSPIDQFKKTLVAEPCAGAGIQETVTVEVATCWEIAIKTRLKKLALGEPVTTFLPRELATNGFGLLGIELAHATFVETLPPHHKDPFDLLLVAQAMIEKLPLVSGLRGG